MKRFKLLTALLVAVLIFASCAKPVQDDKLSIRYLESAASATSAFIGGIEDFALLAEPTASMALKQKDNAKIVFDIQKLYGEDGYPQAVMMVKNSLIDDYPNLVKLILSEMEESQTWLLDNAENAVSGIMAASNDTSTLNAALLTEDALINSNISIKLASQTKESVKKYLQDIIAVDSDSAKQVDDSFFATISDDAQNKDAVKQTIKIAAPDGAPALALAKLIYEDNQFDSDLYDINYSVINASQIGATAKTVDIIIMPINAASKIMRDGYKMVSVNTHGNLYIVGPKSFDGDITDLKGKTLISFGLGLVPDLTLKVILGKNGISYKQAG